MGNLDGVFRKGDKLIVNDWINGKVFEVDESGKANVILESKAGLADISGNDDVLLMPMMLDGVLKAYKFK